MTNQVPMPKCQEVRDLLSQIKALQEQLFSSNQELVISNREKRKNWYPQLQATSYQLKAKIEQLKSLLSISEIEAERILGEKKLFLGSEAVKELFDVELEKTDIPPIPFSKRELEQAAELDQVLILVIKQDKDGNPLTAKRIGEVTDEKLKQEDPAFQKLFYNTDWYQGAPFYIANIALVTLPKTPITAMKEKAVQAKWILISKETLPNSKDKNFLKQTFVLAEHLEDNVLPQIKEQHRRQPYLEALAELEEQRETLEAKAELFNLDAWNQLAEEQKIQLTHFLTNLKINQLTRPDFATMIYLQAMYLKIYHQYLLTNEYAWVNETNTTLPSRFVCIGRFDRYGIGVGRCGPIACSGSLGISFFSSL